MDDKDEFRFMKLGEDDAVAGVTNAADNPRDILESSSSTVEIDRSMLQSDGNYPPVRGLNLNDGEYAIANIVFAGGGLILCVIVSYVIGAIMQVFLRG